MNLKQLANRQDTSMNLKQSIKQNVKSTKEKLLMESEQKKYEKSENTFQGLLFVGNRHETVPLRLLTDPYLTPRAKTAWQMIKLNAQQFQGSIFPSYEQLGLWLSERAFQNKMVSRKIISQTLLLLRLTRWLTLCETVRDEKGQIVGNVYIMNDEPLSIADSLQLNGDYLRLLEKSAKHSDPLVNEVANAIIYDVSKQNNLWHFISHISVIRERYSIQQMQTLQVASEVEKVLPDNIAKAVNQTKQQLLSSQEHYLNSNMELSKIERELSQKIDKNQSSNMELRQENTDKSLILSLVPNGNSDTQYSTSTNKNKYSTSTDNDLQNFLTLTKLSLSPLEKQQLTRALYDLPVDTQRAVLFEAQSRIASGSVRKPVGCLMGMIQKAKQGDFNPYLLNKSTQQNKLTENTRPTRKLLDISTHSAINIEQRSAQINKLIQMVRC